MARASPSESVGKVSRAGLALGEHLVAESEDVRAQVELGLRPGVLLPALGYVATLVLVVLDPLEVW